MKKKLLSLLMVVCIFASFTVGVIAADSVQEISALINYNIKMKVDNQIWNPTEADGTAIRPITYGGRTYLPVRAVAEKLGIAIDWDNETQTVLIGEKDATPLTAEMIKSTNASFTRDADALYNGNGVFSSGVVVGSQWIGNQFSDCDFLLNGKFQKFGVGGGVIAFCDFVCLAVRFHRPFGARDRGEFVIKHVEAET